MMTMWLTVIETMGLCQLLWDVNDTVTMTGLSRDRSGVFQVEFLS